MKLFCIGRNGQVARALSERAADRNISLLAIGRPKLDATDPHSVKTAINAADPNIVINAAAYTAVDQAETDAAGAHALNTDASARLAEFCAEADIPLIHYSTDYVFDGESRNAYSEDDPINPMGVYGQTKAAGDDAIIAASHRNIIFRTAWVYSPFGKNFVKTMLRLGADRDEISVVSDQIGNPTSALDIADATLSACKAMTQLGSRTPGGVYNLAGSDETSWAGFADAIFEASGRLGGPTAKVRAISTADYPTPAYRPKNSRLSCEKLSSVFGITVPGWQSSLSDVVRRVLTEGETSA